MSRFEELVDKFKQRGYKMTPQRRAILTTLVGAASHPTAEQIYNTVKERMPDISLATVYNTLRELTQMGELDELGLGREGRRYEFSREEHAHLVCLKCGMIEDVWGDFARVKTLFPVDDGFRTERCTVTLYGYCAACILSPGIET